MRLTLLPQIKNFFGHKLGASVGRFVGMMSPVKMHQTAQFAAAKNMPNHLKTNSATGFFDAMGVANSKGFTVADYFSGRTFHHMGAAGTHYTGGEIAGRGILRTGLAVGVGAWGLGRFAMGPDNPVSNSLGFTAQVGMHYGIAAGLSKLHKGVGAPAVAYAGLAAVNLLRPGNNWGPF